MGFLLMAMVLMAVGPMIAGMTMPMVIALSPMGVRMRVLVIMLVRMGVLVGVGVCLIFVCVGMLMFMGVFMEMFVLMLVIPFHFAASLVIRFNVIAHHRCHMPAIRP